MAMKPKNTAMQKRRYGLDLNAARSRKSCLLVDDGVLNLIPRSGTVCVASMMKAIVRVVQPKPIRGSSCLKIIGYSTPPKKPAVSQSLAIAV